MRSGPGLKLLTASLVLAGLAVPVLMLQNQKSDPATTTQAAAEPAGPDASDSHSPTPPPVDEKCDYACYLENVGAMTLQSGPSSALAWVDVISDDAIRVDCHGLYHRVGEVAASKEWPSFYSSDCEYGFVHGVMRGRAGSEKWEPARFVSEGLSYCSSLPTLEDRHQCAHGLGHSVALISPESLKEAIGLCLLLVNGGFKEQCVDGSMMEYAAEYQNISGWMMDPFGYKEYEDTPDPTNEEVDYRTLCTSLDESVRRICFSRLAMFLMSDLDGNLGVIAEVCSSATSIDEEAACHMGFSDYAIEKVARTDPFIPWPPETREQAEDYAVRLVQACSEHPRGDWCIEGAVTVVGHLYTAGTEHIPPICERSPQAWKQACANGLDRAAVLGQVDKTRSDS